MNYNETLDFLFNRLQSFHNNGAVAYKPGLETAFRLSEAFGNPHLRFPSIHVGGTNGKGTTAHSLASVLMECGLKVGLYTSPHLVDFTERIRVNGCPIDQEDVIDFVERYLQMTSLTDTDPSFFELTTIMAFDYFARVGVDVAVIEVGLGGRLDTTNIITPFLSVITNVALDHTALLGPTLKDIATEKAGIIKPNVPVVVGRRNPDTDSVFAQKTTNILFATDCPLFSAVSYSIGDNEDYAIYHDTPWGDITSPLTGICQKENMQTILSALNVITQRGLLPVGKEAIVKGLLNVLTNTGLYGRWTTLFHNPRVVVDTGHNVDGWRHISKSLKQHIPHPLFIVLGFVNDKDYREIIGMLPHQGTKYYFVTPSVNRGLESSLLCSEAQNYGLEGQSYNTVIEGYTTALADAKEFSDALIFVGGSTFVVADLLSYLKNKK